MRRLFLVHVAAVVAALVAAATIAGCDSLQTKASAGIERVNAWTIPGVLRIGSSSLPDNLNPLLGSSAIDSDVAAFWGAYLFMWSNKGEFVPELATEVPTLKNGGISSDGLTITYHLRRGVAWQDGKPFSADDVVFTWHVVMNPKNLVDGRSGYELIRSIEEPDDHTIVVHLRQRYAPFIASFFAMSGSTFCVLPKHALSKYADINKIAYNRLPIGTGPFRVVYDKGSLIKLQANPRYWRGAPLLREITIRLEPDARLLAALRKHEIDFLYEAENTLAPKLNGIPGTTSYLYPLDGYVDVGFNFRSPQVRDKRVRQALAYAIDRADLVDRISNGVDLPANSDQPLLSWAHDDSVHEYSYDPRAAQRLLDEAGWKTGPDGIRSKSGTRLRISLVAAADQAMARAATELIARNWNAVGVRTEVKYYPSDQLYAAVSGLEESGKFDAVFEGWTSGVDPDDSSTFMCRPADPNVYRYCNLALDAAENEAMTTYDVARRKAAYYRVQRIISEDVPVIMLSYIQVQDVVNIDLQNYQPASGVTPFWNTWEWSI